MHLRTAMLEECVAINDNDKRLHSTYTTHTFIAVLENILECSRVGAAVARETTTSVLVSVQLCLLVG